MSKLVGMGTVSEKPSLAEALEHHGVKGMHWGVRRAGIHAARRRVNKAKKTYESEKAKFAEGKITKSKMDKAKFDYLQYPGRSTAVLTTAGEKQWLLYL